MSSIFKPTIILAIALVIATSFAGVAEAGRRHHHRGGKHFPWGVAAGIFAGALLYDAYRNRSHAGDYDYAGGGECYRGPKECRPAGFRCYENSWGEEVCKRHYVCRRPLICD